MTTKGRAGAKHLTLRGGATGKPVEKLMTRAEIVKRKARPAAKKPPMPRPAVNQKVGGEHKPPETIPEYRVALEGSQRHASQAWEAFREERQRRERAEALLHAAGAELVRRNDNEHPF